MSTKTEAPQSQNKRKFSLDTWAVFLALLAALLVRVGAVKHIPW